MRILVWILKKNRIWVFLAIMTGLISNMSQLFFMLNIGELVNYIEEGRNIEVSFIVIIALFLISNSLTLYIFQLTGRYTAEKAAHSLRMGFIKAKIYKSERENEKISVANAMSVAQNELESVNSYLSNTFFEMFSMSLSGILVFVFLLFINVKLTLIILVPTLLTLIYVSISGKKLAGIVNNTLNEKNNMNRMAYSAIDNYSMITVFEGKGFIMKAFEKHADRWCASEKKKDRLYAVFNSLSGVLSRLPLLLLLLSGSYMVVSGRILLGTLIVFLNLQKSVTQFVMNMPMWIARFKTFIVNLSRIEVM